MLDVVEPKRKSNSLLLIPVFLCGLCVFSKDAFNFYDSISLYMILLIDVFSIFTSKKPSLGYFIFALLLGLYMSFSILYNNGGIGSALTLIVTILTIYAYSQVALTKRVCTFLLIISTAVILYLFFRTFGYAEDYYYYKSDYLNPNTVGMYLIYFYMIIYSIKQPNTISKKMGMFVLFIIVLIGVLNCSSRGSLLALLSFTIINLAPDKIITRKTIILISVLVIVLGILFPFVYLGLYRNNIQFELLGKSIYTGREIIWDNMFELFGQNPLNWLFGIGSDEVLMNGKELNVHNDYFSVIVNFGLIGLFLYYGFILIIIIKVSKLVYDIKLAKTLILSFVTSVLLLGMFEVTTLWSAMYPLSLFSIGVLYGQYKMSVNAI